MESKWLNLTKDKKIQEIEALDTISSQIYKAQQTRIKERNNETFSKWLEERTDKNVTINEVLKHLCIDIIKSVNDKGFTITDEKQLKNEIATFIYKEASYYAL